MTKLLKIHNLDIQVKSSQDFILKGVSLDVADKEIVGIVGGSGSGKSTLALSVLGLLHEALSMTQGKISFDSKPTLKRGIDVGYVFQDPMQAFNPVMRVGAQIQETLQYHLKLSKNEAKLKTLDLLKQVGIEDHERIYASYPFQLSGGLRQRAMIAQAICCGPKLIIADEPTSSLDVTLQAKIIELFKELREKLDLSIIFISHDLPLVKYLADRMYVFCEGQVVEEGASDEIAQNPKHEYTKQLMHIFQ